ncbi:MAG: transcriptional regulator [Rhodothermales bacterium]
MQPVDTVAIDPFNTRLFWIGEAAIEPPLHQIRLHDRVNKVEPRVMRVLLCLAAAPGQVLTRTQLLDTAWADTIPNDEGLTQAICKLRKAFGSRAARPRIIETIPKVGYRLVAPVSYQPPTQQPRPSNGQAKARTGRQAAPRRALWTAGPGFANGWAEWHWLTVCLVLLMVFCGLWSSYVSHPPVQPQQGILLHRVLPDMTRPTRQLHVKSFRLDEMPFGISPQSLERGLAQNDKVIVEVVLKRKKISAL